MFICLQGEKVLASCSSLCQVPRNNLILYSSVCPQGEKILLLLHEGELLKEDFLVFLIEFIVSGSISHLFTQEEQTTIINSIRTEVTQAGLTYTRDVAWNFFVRSGTTSCSPSLDFTDLKLQSRLLVNMAFHIQNLGY